MSTFVSTAATLFLALLVLLVPVSSSATSSSATSSSTEKQQIVAAPKILKLQRQSIILPKTAERAGKRKNFYSAKISVGNPGQEFHVAFDLSGGTLVLPAQSCLDPACLERRRFDRLESSSAEDINANGRLVQASKPKTMLRRRDQGTLGMDLVDVGSGKVKGSFVRDEICVHGEGDDMSKEDEEKQPRCFPLAMLVASKMDDLPFVLEPYDGTVGLGLKGMSVSTEFNFLTGFHRGYGDVGGSVFPNSFGLHLGAGEDGGEITLGGYDIKRLTHPLQWAPVAAPEEGRWQVGITAIRVGNNTFEACRDRVCKAAIDYSASLLGVPTKLASGLESILAKLAPPSGFGDGCQHLAIPDIHLDLDNHLTLTLPAEDFVSDFGSRKGLKTSSPSCQPLLTHHHADEPLGEDVFILGESVLRRYYTFFNADTLSVGFSLAVSEFATKDGKTLPALPSGNKGKKALDGDNPVILLVQIKLLRSKTVSSLGL